MADLDAALVRSLATFRSSNRALTCYLGLDPALVPNASALSSHVTSLVDSAARAGAEVAAHGDHDTVSHLREDLRRIRSFLETDLDRSGTRGLGLFAAEADGVWHDVRLPRPLEDAVYVGKAFVLAPLLPFFERAREVVVVVVGRDRGTIQVVRDGRVLATDELSRNGQGRHDQGGWSQARYARSRDKEALDHMREVADAASRSVREGSNTLVAVACLEEQRSTFEALLAPHARDVLLGWVDFEAHDDVEALLPDVERLLEQQLEREHLTLLDRWLEERGQRSGRAADTWRETLEAAADGRVETLLADGRTMDAYECPSCGRGYLEPGTCPLDGTPLEEAVGGALELAVRGTLVNGGDVRVLDPELPGTEVAALLRYPQPAS